MTDIENEHRLVSERYAYYELLEPMPISKHDIALPDVTGKFLRNISDCDEIEYLGPGVFSSPAFPVQGFIHDPNSRLMVSLNCQRNLEPDDPIIKVWFMINTAFNWSFLSEETMCKLSRSESPPSSIRIHIQESSNNVQCSLSRGNFAEANILGMNAMMHLGLTIEGMNTMSSSFRLAKQ